MESSSCAKCTSLRRELAVAVAYKQDAYARQSSDEWDTLVKSCETPGLALELRKHYYWYRAQLTHTQILLDLVQHERHEHC